VPSTAPAPTAAGALDRVLARLAAHRDPRLSRWAKRLQAGERAEGGATPKREGVARD
jgi:hypothetical protein